MAAINAAWELIGEPAKRRRTTRSGRRDRARGDDARSGGGPARRRPGPHGRARQRAVRLRRRRPRPSRATGPRAVDAGQRLRGVDARAEGFGAAGPPPGRPSGTVLNFGRYAGWSLGEVARTTSSTSSGSIARRSAATTARRSTRSCARAAGASRPTGETSTAQGCSADASGVRRRLRPRSGGASRDRHRGGRSGPSTQLDGRSLDEQREQIDPEGDLLESGAAGYRPAATVPTPRPPPRADRPRTGRAARSRVDALRAVRAESARREAHRGST
jgi:hypothetical protein